MTRKEKANRLSDILHDEYAFSPHWACAPLVMHLPYMGKREEFFLEVVLHLKNDLNSRDHLIKECLRIATTIIKSNLLADEKGVEVTVYRKGQENPRRICRLIVLSRAFGKLHKAQVADVILKNIDGLTFQSAPSLI